MKGLSYDTELVDLSTGAHLSGKYKIVNSQGRVPTLIHKDKIFIQSISIIEYLEEAYPTPSLLPSAIEERAWVRAIANIIACDIHPLNNLAVLNYLTGVLSIGNEQKLGWYRHWVAEGLEAIERMLSENPNRKEFCYGDKPGLADICLVPQVFNAQRFECDLSGYPLIEGIFNSCMKLEAFDLAQPSKQPEAESIN